MYFCMVQIDVAAVIPLDSAHRRAWIKYQLELRGITLKALSLSNGLFRNSVAQALWRPYPHMERIIAEALGMRPEVIWPERYSAMRHPAPRHRTKGRHTADVSPRAAEGNGNIPRER